LLPAPLTAWATGNCLAGPSPICGHVPLDVKQGSNGGGNPDAIAVMVGVGDRTHLTGNYCVGDEKKFVVPGI
jgi:hypothetical protein